MYKSNQAHQDFLQAWQVQLREKPWLKFSLLGMLLLFTGLFLVSTKHGMLLDNFYYAVIGGFAGLLATSLGALLVFSTRTLSMRVQDSLLGFAAGMMLAASAFSLILPGIEAAQEILEQRFLAASIVVLGLALGTLMMLALNYLTPHNQVDSTLCDVECQRLGGIWLFVFAIALHNLPEGMAIGISFTHGDFKIGLPLTLAIAIQDVPEGFAVALAMRSVEFSNFRAFMIGAATGLLEPLGAVLGFALSSSLILSYPLSMGLAAGAMIL